MKVKIGKQHGQIRVTREHGFEISFYALVGDSGWSGEVVIPFGNTPVEKVEEVLAELNEEVK